jgi:hypothetical protein
MAEDDSRPSRSRSFVGISALAAGRVQSALQALNKQDRVKGIRHAEERFPRHGQET